MSEHQYRKMVVGLLFLIFATLLVGGCIIYGELSLINLKIELNDSPF